MTERSPEPSEEEKRRKTISLGPAVLRRMDERDHFGMFRPVLVTGWDDENGCWVKVTSRELGPLKIFRPARGADRVDVRTFDPVSKTEVLLHQTWDARDEAAADMDLLAAQGVRR